MEEDLKILKVEYLSNHLSLDDKTMFYKSLKSRLPPMEDDLKILKVEYLSNCFLYYNQILKLSLEDQKNIIKSLK